MTRFSRSVPATWPASAGVSPDDTTAELTRWRAAIAAGDPFDELVLWYEHDLFDQLNLIQLLSWLAALPGGAPRTTLISINTFPGRDHFKGLGELTPPELASLFGARQPVGASQFALAQSSWQAFRSSDPRSIEQLLDGDTSALPFLAAALRRHLEEFPWTGDGLSRTERRLLELLAPGPTRLGAIFPRMHDLETAFYIADLSFLDVAMGLAAAAARPDRGGSGRPIARCRASPRSRRRDRPCAAAVSTASGGGESIDGLAGSTSRALARCGAGTPRRSGSCSPESGRPDHDPNNDATASSAPGTMKTAKKGSPLIASAHPPNARYPMATAAAGRRGRRSPRSLAANSVSRMIPSSSIARPPKYQPILSPSSRWPCT